jgi:hypothetical protein
VTADRVTLHHQRLRRTSVITRLVGLVDLVGWDDLDFGADVVLGADVQHLLGQSEIPPIIDPAYERRSPMRENTFRLSGSAEAPTLTRFRRRRGDRGRRRLDPDADWVDDHVEVVGEVLEGVGVRGRKLLVGADEPY